MRKTLAALALIAGSMQAQAFDAAPATPSPENLSEAIGLFVGASEYLRHVQGTSCGYAIRRQPRSMEQAFSADVAPLLSKQESSEVLHQLTQLQPTISEQSNSLFRAMYSHYTRTEGLDHSTACGFVASNAIATRKLTLEAMQRLSGARPH